MSKGHYISVQGVPAPQGSLRAINNPHTGKAMLIPGGDDASRKRLDAWRKLVNRTALDSVARSEYPLIEKGCPVFVAITFGMPRLKKHLKADGAPRDDAPVYVASTPDIDKCVRAILDALTGVIYVDDKQVAALSVKQVYDLVPGVRIYVEEIEQ